jgi:hypothetical protein
MLALILTLLLGAPSTPAPDFGCTPELVRVKAPEGYRFEVHRNDCEGEPSAAVFRVAPDFEPIEPVYDEHTLAFAGPAGLYQVSLCYENGFRDFYVPLP